MSSLDAILARLLDGAGPPRSVGELEAALGIALDDGIAAASSYGFIQLTQGNARALGPRVKGLSVSYAFSPYHGRPVRELSALRTRPLRGWTASFDEGRASVEGALAARFGAPRVIPTGHVYELWIVQGEPGSERCTLSRYDTLPDFAVPPPDLALRARCIEELATIAATGNFEALHAAATSFAAAAGIALTPRRANELVLDLQLVPPMSAEALARCIGWRDIVAQSTSIYQDDWEVRLVVGEGQAVVPRLGRWRIVARLDRRPNGGPAAGFNPVAQGGTHRFAAEDCVRHLRFVSP
jgi:hypothetical protein